MWWWLGTGALAGGWPEITPLPSSGGGANDVAVVVGIENYMLVDDIAGARTNAEDWYSWFTSTRGISVGRVHLLRDFEATREKIERFASEAASTVGEGGTLWFVFVGHGAATPDGQDGVLVGADAQSDPDSLYARSVARSALLDTLATGAQANTVLVLDTCFSGKTGRGSITEGLQPLIPSYAFTPAAAVTVLAAGAADQFAGPLPEAGRPAFSYLVLGALTGWGDANGDGDVTAAEAVSYAQDAISATVKGREQTPELSGEDLVLASGGAAVGPDIAQMVLDAGPPRALPDELAVLRDERAAIRAAQEREEARQAALAESTRHELAGLATALQEKAAREWGELGDDAAPADLLSFVQTYGDAVVDVGSDTLRVTVSEVADAQARLAGADRAVPVSAPEPWDQPTSEMASAALWRPIGAEWKASLAEDPAQIWLPYQVLHAMEEVIDYHTCFNCDTRPKREALVRGIVLDAATYAEAWATTDDAAVKRSAELALVGLVKESQDVARYLTDTLLDDAPEAFGEHAAFGMGGAMDKDGFDGLLSWAVLEVLDRAEDAPACASLVPKLTSLAEDARAFGPTFERYDDDKALEKRHKKGRALARKVHKCAGDEARLDDLQDQFGDAWW